MSNRILPVSKLAAADRSLRSAHVGTVSKNCRAPRSAFMVLRTYCASRPCVRKSLNVDSKTEKTLTMFSPQHFNCKPGPLCNPMSKGKPFTFIGWKPYHGYFPFRLRCAPSSARPEPGWKPSAHSSCCLMFFSNVLITSWQSWASLLSLSFLKSWRAHVLFVLHSGQERSPLLRSTTSTAIHLALWPARTQNIDLHCTFERSMFGLIFTIATLVQKHLSLIHIWRCRRRG